MNKESSATVLFFRLIVIFIVVAQYIVLRNHFINDYFLTDYIPVESDFFPFAFSNPYAGSALLLMAIILGLYICFFQVANAALKLYAGFTVLFSIYMNIHQQGFFVQSFVTTFWVGLLLLWLSMRIEKGESEARDWLGKGMFLSKVIISLVFLGGTLGKMNDYYWSGRAFEVLNVHNPITQLFGYEVFGKLVVMGEFILALTVLMPNRWAFKVSFFLLLGMYLSTGYKIFDAIGPLMGLAFANLVLSHLDRFKFLFDRRGMSILFIAIFVFTNVLFKLITLTFYR